MYQTKAIEKIIDNKDSIRLFTPLLLWGMLTLASFFAFAATVKPWLGISFAVLFLMIIPVVITVYADHSFTFITKTPPAAVLIKKACNIDKASGEPNKNKVAQITKEQIRKIAETKMPDLNAANIDTAMSMIAGTARSMGITVEE